jgi:hypothetical protein
MSSVAVVRAMNEALVVRGAFAGLTEEKIPVVTDALAGHMVRVSSSHVHAREDVGVFYALGYDGLAGGLSVRVGVIEPHDVQAPTVRPRSTRHVGVLAVASLDVIGPERIPCDHCGGWALPSALLDLGPDWSPERRLCCRAMDEFGECAWASASGAEPESGDA